MIFREMFKKTYISLNPGVQVYGDNSDYGNNSVENVDKGPMIPDGSWIKCDICNQISYYKEVLDYLECCPKCNAHFRLGAKKRLSITLDHGSFVEWNISEKPKNPLNFPGYDKKISELQEKIGMQEAIITGEGKINGYRTAVACMDSSFLMGSMGQVVGEKVTDTVERATENRLPIIIFTASGGARMQEGMFSLMQMAKTSAALKKHNDAGLLYITVLTDPTTGGVTASFAMLGDIIIAEPGALIGFAGPRVIEQTIRQKLPDGFQRAEFLMEKGFVDRVVARSKLKEELGAILKLH